MSSWRQRRWGGAGCRRTGLTQLLGGRGCGVGIPAVTHTLLRTLFWAPGPQAVSPVTPRASESAGPGPASRARWAVVSSPALQPTPPAGLLHGPAGLEPGSASPCRKTLASQPSRVSGGTSAPSSLRTGHSASPGVPSAGVLCACFIRKQDPALWRLEKDERRPPLPGPSPPGAARTEHPRPVTGRPEAPGPRRTGRRRARPLDPEVAP